MPSRFFGSKVPDVPHLVKVPGGIAGEIKDLRDDIEEAFLDLEANSSIVLTVAYTGWDADPAGPGHPVVFDTAIPGTWYLRDTPPTIYVKDSAGVWQVVGTVSSSGAWVINVSRNSAVVTDTWLRSGEVPTNLAPFVMGFDARIVAVVGSGNQAQTWDGEVYRNSDVRSGGVPSDGNKLAEVQVAAATSVVAVVGVDVDAGDEVGVFLRGTGIDTPHVSVYMVRR